MKDTLQAIRDRRSIRKYEAKPVPDGVLEELLELAQMAPSAKNVQPWKITIVKDKKLLQQINSEAKAYLAQNGEVFKEEFNIFHNAPAVVMISGLKENMWTEIDCGILAATLCIAAEAMGLGTCVIGYARRAFLDEKSQAYYAEKLGVGKDHRPLFGVSIGYIARHPEQRPREYKVNVVE